MTDLSCRCTTAFLISLCAWVAPPNADAAQSPSATFDPGIFAADVVVERVTVNREGAVVDRMPKVRYRLIERPGPAGLTTEISFHDTPPFPGRGPLQDVSAGFRVLIDENEGMTVVDPSGTTRSPAAAGTPPDGAMRPVTAKHGRGASHTMPRAAAARRDSLIAQFGKPVDRHRERDRFLRHDSETVEEVLVDPDTSLPVEINLLRRGRLVHTSSVSYASLPDGRFYRSAQRDESLAAQADDEGLRHVVTTTYSLVTGGVR
jgi:hypothetical protein